MVQNGAGSGVGRAIIQLAAARGVRTVNILRDRRAACCNCSCTLVQRCAHATHADMRVASQARL